MKKYTITIPDDKNEFFLELIKSLGFSIQEGGEIYKEGTNIPEWQLDMVEQRISKSSEKNLQNWDDIKDQFQLD